MPETVTVAYDADTVPADYVQACELLKQARDEVKRLNEAFGLRKYHVCLSRDVKQHTEVTVEARNEIEASDLAWDVARNGAEWSNGVTPAPTVTSVWPLDEPPF